MIEKMKVVSIVSVASRKKELMDELRRLGVLHLAEKKSADAAHSERIAALSDAIAAIQDYAEKVSAEPLCEDAFAALLTEVSDARKTQKSVAAARADAVSAAELLRKWGAFSPADFEILRQSGIDLHIYRVDKRLLAALAKDESVRYIRLSAVEKREVVAVLGTLPEEFFAEEFHIGEKGLADWEKDIAAYDARLDACQTLLQSAAVHLPDFRAHLLAEQNSAEYSCAYNTAQTENGLVWLSGYLPLGDAEAFKEAAAQNHWAWAMDDPAEEDEQVPTKVRYNKMTRLMTPIFDILGIVPGYREYDISFWFLGFFSLFFAMILGDAAYGCLMLLAAVAAAIKTKKSTPLLLLSFVLSISTIFWGAITGTWFGMESAMEVPFLRSLVIPVFANYPQYFGLDASTVQNTVMKFCFTIGTVQLSLACLLSIKNKLPKKDLSFVADIGWLSAICALYFLVLYLVIGEPVSLLPVAVVVGIGFVLVVLFGAMSAGKPFAQGVKEGLGGAFTTFLNTVSAFGNVMSYIRLFAVGMASLAIAQSFNSMAAGFSGPLVVVGVVIVLIGHAMNLAMGLLSVFVHGVRLNLLEFSGQLGMEWTGIAYQPFKISEKIKK